MTERTGSRHRNPGIPRGRRLSGVALACLCWLAAPVMASDASGVSDGQVSDGQVSDGQVDERADGKSDGVVLRVVDPFVEMHTAPGRGYPVFHVIEKGEQVEILKRKTNWYKVRTPAGKEGWTKASQLGRTLEPTGIPADLPDVGHGEYLESSWRVGFTAGQFEQSTSFSLTLGYRPLTWAGMEVEAGKIYNQSVTSDYYAANVIIEPFQQWDVTPYALVGVSRFSFDARQKILLSDIEDADAVNFGGGASYYIGRNFLIRAEYRVYSVSTRSDTTGLSEWKIGLNTFF